MAIAEVIDEARQEAARPPVPTAFGTDEWIKAVMAAINRSEAYREAARTWEGDFNFVVKFPDGAPDAVMYMDLWHGTCRAAYRVEGPQERAPEYVVVGPLATWRKVLERKLDPIMSLVTRQLLLSGQLLKVMRVPRATLELVHCCTLVPTEWPE